MHKHGSHGHGHSHSHAEGGSAVLSALKVALVLNLSFLIVEVVAGLATGSLALLSDAGHMISDVAALGLALIAQRLAEREPRPGGAFTYGLKRAPVLGAFGNALALLAIVAVIFWEAAKRLMNPPDIPGWPVLVVGILGLLINVASAWWLYRSSSSSLNVRGAMLHLAADALGSIGAIIAAVVLITTGWAAIDALVSFVIGGLILWAAWPLLRDSTKVLLEAAPLSVNVKTLRAHLTAAEEVNDVQDLHIWELDSGRMVMTALLETHLADLGCLEQAADRLRDQLHERFGIDHCTIEWRSDAVKLGCTPSEPNERKSQNGES